MRAIVSTEPGPPETLVLVEEDDPVPGSGEVVVEVRAAALNFFDTLIIADRYQFKPPRPFSPAAEMAGRVAALGEGVTGLAIGDRVMGWLGHGCCRSHVVIAADKLHPIPDGVSDEVASGLAVTYGTTLHALRDRGDLKPGETLAVLGAAGGVGQAAVEVGKLMGARVVACASSDDKTAIARELGADALVNYGRSGVGAQGLRDALRAATDGRGVDVVYDPVGGDLAEPALRAITWLGRYLVIGFASGVIPKLPLNLVLLKGCDVRGVFWGSFIERDPDAHRAALGQLLAWVADGKLAPRIDSVWPLNETPRALEKLAAGEAMGKVIVVP